MCRHICPIGNATGHERNTARARGMILALVARGGVEYSADIIDNVYECALCGACTKECVTGWDPVAFTKEARLVAALEGKLPKYIDRMLENLEKTGNVYGKTELDAALKAEIEKHSVKTDVLFLIGRDAMYLAPENAVRAIKALDKAGVKFTVLENEPDSGYASEFLIGAAEETRQTAVASAKVFDEYKKVICYEAQDAMMLMQRYKEWGIELKCEVQTFTACLAELVESGKIKEAKTSKAYTFQDPVHLARDIEETEPARKIISAFGENREMLLFGKDTMLGGNLIMNEYMPDVMRKVAEDRWINAAGVNAETVVTASTADYVIMKSVKPEGVEIMTIEELVL